MSGRLTDVCTPDVENGRVACEKTMSSLQDSGAPPSVPAQQEYWDRRWEQQQKPNRWQQQRAEVVLAIARDLPLDKPRILDLGCGTGFTTKMLSQLGTAEGIDLSPIAVAIARAEYPDVRFRSGDLFEIDLSETPLDLIVCQEVIPHVHDQYGMLRKISAALKPGGYLIATAANKFVMKRLGDNDGGLIGSGPADPDEHIKNWLSRRELKSLMSEHFTILKSTTIIPVGSRGLLRVINSYKLNNVLERMTSRQGVENLKGQLGFGYTIIVVGQKLH